MREILFRGKWTDNNEWVYGYVVHFKSNEWTIHDDSTSRLYQVDPNTVGQYTGLTDKNGTKIFEGDILRGSTDSPAPGKTFIVRWNRMFSRFQANSLEHDGERYNAMIFSESEIIGNMNDNPKLVRDDYEKEKD